MNYVLCIVLFVPFIYGIEHDFSGFDDSIVFTINWPGLQKIDTNEVVITDETKNQSKEIIKVKTSKDESYQCSIPKITVNNHVKEEVYTGEPAYQRLQTLFQYEICSYRLEGYWSYEVCHGRYIRQYHEEKDGKQVKVQEFFLGRWDPQKQKQFESEQALMLENKQKPKTVRLFGGVPMPTLEMVMDDGTLCDLNGKSRKTKVYYVCYSSGSLEVFSFKETSTCEYELIVLTNMLCDHPDFKPEEVKENDIECLPVGNSPVKPHGLLEMETESLKSQFDVMKNLHSDYSDSNKKSATVWKIHSVEKDGETFLRFELQPNAEGVTASSVETPQQLDTDKKPPTPPVDDGPIRAFLNGETCLYGGSGWWKYDFCYGKHVSQFHVDRNGEKTTVLLGKFDKQAHLDWIKENKGKAPKPIGERTSISHLYSNGDICDKTGKPRQTEVKLKCLENWTNPAQVSLYLLEPRTCHYILGVESPLICDILPLADENGLVEIKADKQSIVDKLSSNDVDKIIVEAVLPVVNNN